MLLMCFSVAPSEIDEQRRDAHVGAALGHRGQDVALARRQCLQPVVGLARDHELGDDLGVEGGPAPGDTPEGVHELADVRDPVLEQVADAAGAVRQQLRRVLPLHVLAEHEDGRPGNEPTRLDRRAQPLVALGRRHPDVHDGHVRPMVDDRLHEARPVADLRDDLAARVRDDPREALADERRVLGDDDAQAGLVHGTILRHPSGARRAVVRSAPWSICGPP